MAKKKRGFLDGYKTYDTSTGFCHAGQWRGAFGQRMGRDEAEAIIKSKDKTPWEILGVAQNASPQEITKAYRAKMMEWHPDRNPHREAEAVEMSKAINAAYEIIGS